MSETYYRSPYGCSSSGGRWNPPGTRMIYTGSAPTVSLFEYLSIKGSAVSKRKWFMIEFEITDESLVGIFEKSDLPNDWDAIPHSHTTQAIGKKWLDQRGSPFLKVPSSRVSLAHYPETCNILINPDYPDVSNLCKVVDTSPFNYLLNW